MRYEFLLQAATPGTTYDPTDVDRLLLERGVMPRADGVRVWTLSSGEVEVQTLVEAGRVLGTELRVRLGEKTDLVRQAMLEGVQLAEQAQVALYDPQLSRVLSLSDEAVVADRFGQTSRWAGQYLGLPEAIAASYPAPPEDKELPVHVKLGLAAGAALLVLYWVVKGLIDALRL